MEPTDGQAILEAGITEFERWLLGRGCAEQTVRAYGFAIRQLSERNVELTQEGLLAHRTWLAETYAAKTANLRITAVNSLLDWLETARGGGGVQGDGFVAHGLPRLRRIRMQQRPFLDNVISREEYERLRDGLRAEGDLFWHFVVRFLAGTGARVSELVRFTTGDVRQGYLDLICKGDKLRRIWVPQGLQADALAWLEDRPDAALVFAGGDGQPLTSRAISYGIKRAARRHGVPSEVAYPHSFRHLFAKSFIARNPDIALLADLMGHGSIETTRIYLRQTAAEQRVTVDAIVDW